MFVGLELYPRNNGPSYRQQQSMGEIIFESDWRDKKRWTCTYSSISFFSISFSFFRLVFLLQGQASSALRLQVSSPVALLHFDSLHFRHGPFIAFLCRSFCWLDRQGGSGGAH